MFSKYIRVGHLPF